MGWVALVRPSQSAVRGMIERGSTWLLDFSEAPIVTVWAGLIDITSDGLPLIEARPEFNGLIVSAGFLGHDFDIGSVTGQRLRDLLLETAPDLQMTPFYADDLREQGKTCHVVAA